ncbi:MAG: DUF5696 domain-containing protein [Candidatus Howiella sp.]|jgi:hypothetical protein
MKKKIIACLLLVSMIAGVFSFAAVAEEETVDATASAVENVVAEDSGEAANDTSAPYTTTALSAEFEKVTGNDSLELYVNKSIGSIGVKDLETGYIWYSSVANDVYSRDGLTAMQLDQLNSLFVLTYTILNDNNNKTFSYPINNMEPQITVSNISGGVRLTYYISSINLELAVDVTLDGDTLDVSIPKDALIEGKGTDDRMNEQIVEIHKFIEECRAAIDEVDAIGISKNNKEIKQSRKKLDELEELVNGIDSLVGVAAAQSKASIILQDELANYLIGGKGGTEGIFARTANSDKAGDQKSHFKSLRTSMDTKLKKCVSKFSLLTSIQLGGVVNIELLPNLGAAGDYEDGYVFYPDGSGALTYSTPNHGQSTEVYETSIYSDTTVDMSWENNRDSTGLKRMMLPVYGSKKNNQAFLAIIEEGDTDASICLLPSGNSVNLNRINSKFTYRTAVQITSSSEYSTGLATIFEKNALDISPKVKYTFLNGREYTPDYSGMANAYRDYLIENGEMKKSELLSDQMPLALDFITGTWKSMLFYNSYVSISSFEEIQSVVEELNANGISDLLLYLEGWEKTTYPSTFKIPSGSGGAEGLQSLMDTLRGSGGEIFLNSDFVYADTFTRSISESKLALGSDSRIYEYDTYWYKLFSPGYIRDNMQNVVNGASKLGNPGLAVYSMGSLIYSDYNTRYNTKRADCADIWNGVYQTLEENNIPTASYGGNKYLLNVADWLRDIPMSSSGYTFADESVPFYQMVVHGSIPYSAKPFNHFYDQEKEKLQTIEYGCIPMYKLTYNDSSTLRKLFNDFTTPYADVKDSIIETYNEFNGKLASLTTEYMVSHEKLTDMVVRVGYSDGTLIYINYADTPYTTDTGITIPAKDYAIV